MRERDGVASGASGAGGAGGAGAAGGRRRIEARASNR